MADQLFTSHGYVKPTTSHKKHGRREPQPCGVEGCTNPRRNTQAAKYCEEHATSINYELRQTVPEDQHGPCLVCGTPVTRRRRISQRVMFLCRDHGHLQPVLTKWRHTYNLTDDKITELITNPYCWICQASLKWRFANWGTDKKNRDQVHVEHDHRCCPGETSCGNCVRGLAHHPCNRRLGALEAMLKDLGTERVHQLIDELQP